MHILKKDFGTMGKLLIAVRSEVLAGSIARAMPPGWDICICRDGNTAADFLLSQKPDALIIELRLPEKDGLAVLAENFPALPPAILALTDYTSDYIQNTAASLGISYFIQLPSPSAKIAERITDIASSLVTPPSLLSRHLSKLGINTGLDGYQCLLVAIPELKADPTRRLHKELYPLAMEACGLTDVRCVERSIRFAIQKAWENRDETVWAYYFPPEKYGDGCPNNRAFIRRLAELI